MSAQEGHTRQVRLFHLATVQWEPADYTQIIDWERQTVSEPPITLTMTDDDIRDIVPSPHPSQRSAYPVHTQAVG